MKQDTGCRISDARPKNLVGTYLEDDGTDGGLGLAAQREYDKAGIPTNYGPGLDLPLMNVEIKANKDTKTGPAKATLSRAKNNAITYETKSLQDIADTKGRCFTKQLANLDYIEVNVTSCVRSVDRIPISCIKEEIIAEIEVLGQNVNQILKGEKDIHSESIFTESKNYRIEIVGQNDVEKVANLRGTLRLKGGAGKKCIFNKANSTYNNIFTF